MIVPFIFYFFERTIPFAREYGGSSLWTCLTLRYVLLSEGSLRSTVNAMDNQKIERRPLQLNQTVEASVGKVIIDRCYNFDLLHLGPRDYSLPI